MIQVFCNVADIIFVLEGGRNVVGYDFVISMLSVNRLII